MRSTPPSRITLSLQLQETFLILQILLRLRSQEGLRFLIVFVQTLLTQLLVSEVGLTR
jgi:hypothetical protein